MKPFLLVVICMLAACTPSPPPAAAPKIDPAGESWYPQTVRELGAMNRQAQELVRAGKPDEAARIIAGAQPLATRLNSAPQPPLDAMEAISDCVQFYANMLLANKNYGWARLEFQKNVSRWKSWQPQTADTGRRLKLARDGIAECDRHIE
jgi:hypothetical protein